MTRRLTREDEVRLATAAQAGDVEARNELVEANIPLVYLFVAKRRSPSDTCLRADLVQEGCLGLIDAVKGWSSSYGTRFGCYAARCIRTRIGRCRDMYRHQSEFSIDQADDCDRSWHEIIADAYNLGDDVDKRTRDATLRSVLTDYPWTPRESTFIRMRWFQECTQDAVGRELGVTRQRAEQVEKKITRKLRRRLAYLRESW